MEGVVVGVVDGLMFDFCLFSVLNSLQTGVLENTKIPAADTLVLIPA